MQYSAYSFALSFGQQYCIYVPLFGGKETYIYKKLINDIIFSKSPSEIDDYLFKTFKIYDEIRKHIEEILPDYYGIRKG